MRVLAIAGAIAVGVLCGIGLTLRPAAAQEPQPGRSLVLAGPCLPLATIDAGLADRGFHVIGRAHFDGGPPVRIWRRADGEWRVVLYLPGADGEVMGCSAAGGTDLTLLLGEGA